jgi:DNA-binding NarL/FixJ family response regulator
MGPSSLGIGPHQHGEEACVVQLAGHNHERLVGIISMKASEWAQRTDNDSVARRAGGRRRHNAVRQTIATVRRFDVLRLSMAMGFRHGSQAEIARQLGVSQATITRDVRQVLREIASKCPTCGAPVGPARARPGQHR